MASYDSMHTAELRARLERASDRAERAATMEDYLADLFVIQTIIIALKKKGAY